MSPKVSIITAVYNSGKFIEETIKCVVNQTFTDWELILIDDGSIDNSKSIINKYLTDKRIICLFQENQGQARARNNGYKISKGEYIAILDADDIWEHTKLEKQIKFIESNKNIGLIYTNLQYIDDSGAYIKTKPLADITDFPLKNQILSNSTPYSSLLLRRSCINDVIQNENYPYTGDCYLTIQIALQGFKFGFINEELLLYRIHANSISKNIKTIESVFLEQISMLKELNICLNKKHEYKNILKKAYSLAHLSYVHKLIEFGTSENRIHARQVIFKAIFYSFNIKIQYKFIKQFIKSCIYSLIINDKKTFN